MGLLDDLGKEVISRALGGPAAAASGIAQVLPPLIDKLTPDGQPVGADVLQQGIQALLGGKLGDLGKLFS